MAFILEHKLQKYIFSQSMTIFAAAYTFILNPRWNGNTERYATTYELKNTGFILNSENMKGLELRVAVTYASILKVSYDRMCIGMTRLKN